MKLSKKLIIVFVVVITVIAASVLGFKYTEKIRKNNKNKEMIRNVVEKIFTCPDEEMIKLYHNMIQKSLASSDSDVVSLKSKELDKKMDELYSTYFSEEYFETFRQEYYINYNIYSTAEGYQIKVKRIEVTQSKSIPTNYSFTVFLNYGLKGEAAKDLSIDGSAQISKNDGKISYIRFFDKELMNELIQNRASENN